MPLPRLIPCLDVAGGRVVKGVRFEGLTEVGDPVELGALYSDSGADELVYLDVKATLDGRDALVELVARIADRLAIPFTVGGGVRSVADAAALLEAGADKISVNSAALERPELLSELAGRLGSQAVVVAIDATRGEVRDPCRHRGRKSLGRRLGTRGRRPGRGRDPAHVDRRRRHEVGLRPRAHRVRERGRDGSRDRIGRSGKRRARRRGARCRAGGAPRVDPP